VRRACRDAFHRTRLLDRIIPDIHAALGFSDGELAAEKAEFDVDQATPGGLNATAYFVALNAFLSQYDLKPGGGAAK
jgi:hypothetical protein